MPPSRAGALRWRTLVRPCVVLCPSIHTARPIPVHEVLFSKTSQTPVSRANERDAGTAEICALMFFVLGDFLWLP